MFRLIRRWFIPVLIIISIVFFVVKVGPILTKGYDMFEAVIKEVPIKEKCAQIRSDAEYVPIHQISELFLEKVIESEDRRFYEHKGINLSSTVRAFIKNIQAGSHVEGGSSITQQLAKNMYFTFEKRYERKVAELLVAFELEEQLTKDEILELYCNIAYFGEGAYGIEEAARHYYGVSAKDLNAEQSDALVKTLKSPNYYNPNKLNKKDN